MALVMIKGGSVTIFWLIFWTDFLG